MLLTCNIFATSSILSQLQKVNMTRSSIPVLNLKLLCSADLLNISLWRDEALSDLNTGDNIEITHLYCDMVHRGRGHLHSSQYTTVKVMITQSKLHTQPIHTDLLSNRIIHFCHTQH